MVNTRLEEVGTVVIARKDNIGSFFQKVSFLEKVLSA